MENHSHQSVFSNMDEYSCAVKLTADQCALQWLGSADPLEILHILTVTGQQRDKKRANTAFITIIIMFHNSYIFTLLT